jgi:hypothetical protein
VCTHLSLDVCWCPTAMLEALLLMSVPRLQTLRVSLPFVGARDVPYLRHMTDLRSLELGVRSKDGYVLDPQNLPRGLRRLRARVLSSGAFGYVPPPPGTTPLPPDVEVYDESGAVLWRRGDDTVTAVSE